MEMLIIAEWQWWFVTSGEVDGDKAAVHFASLPVYNSPVLEYMEQRRYGW